jgi:cellulose synthase/poly-beta-1,6-N-acetylglucosamine synthase-like glycosyltransferase
MKFSVVIPLYNKAPYIASTLASVLAQSVRDFEIVVVDDGSTDGSDQIVAALVRAQTDRRLRLVRRRNAGVSVARNTGIDQARGDWVVFLDADDWQHPGFLAALQEAEQRFPAAGVLATDVLLIPHSEGAWPPHWEYWQVKNCAEHEVELISDLPTRWMQGPSLSSSSVAVKSSLLLRMQPCFAPGETVGEDLDLWFRLAEKTPVALVRTPLAAYRVALQGSLSAAHTPETVPPYLLRMRERARSGQLLPAQRRSALRLVAQQHVTHARHAIAQGHRLLGLRWLMRSLYGARTRRWWLTLGMALLVPGKFVSRWQAWRVGRSSPATPLRQAS